jgi:hypothetical protein
MKKLLILLFSFFLLSSPSVFAGSVSLSCEAGRVSGVGKTLENNFYNNISPAMIINSQKKQISFSYLVNDRRRVQIFQILKEDEFNIVGSEHMDADWADIFHFNKKEKTFSIAYVGDTGNTMTYGRCFD